MGFLNHATNNVIVDAVLTEKGRELLSRNDGSFSISQFRFGDDEVDYRVLEHYGLIIGKEKIEKNTPVFEAITDENIALKYPLKSFTSNNTNTIYAFPYIVLNQTDTPVTLSSNSDSSPTAKSKLIRFKTYVNQDEGFSVLDNSLIDNTYVVKVFNKLLRIEGSTPDTRGDIDYYTISQNANDNISEFNGQRFGSFTITPTGVVTSSSYQYYSQSSDRTTIKTQVEITGLNTQSSLVVPVTITSSTIKI